MSTHTESADADRQRRRWAEAVVDLAAIGHNARVLAERVAPAAVWAVVKADAYGHGAVPVARAALEAGVQGLCVALIDEGVELRRHCIEAPILVLSPQPDDDLERAVESSLALTVHSVDQIDALALASRQLGRTEVPVHVKVDTGMHRVGAVPAEVPNLVRRILHYGVELRWDGMFSHLACADDPEHHLTERQLDLFDGVLDALAEVDLQGVRRHLANSAAALAWPRAHHDLVRVGIALYGLEPGPGVAELCGDLHPAMSLRSRVTMVKRVPAGYGVSYGWRTVLERDALVATVPVGYADGVPRRLSSTGGEVLIGGHRRPIVGSVTMDQLMVDCGDGPVQVGDEVVLLGRQGDEFIGAEEWAERLGTIPYEIVCGISARVPRRWIGAGQ